MSLDELDEDTKMLFEEIAACLRGLFGYSDLELKKLIESYLAEEYSESEEELLHHVQAFRAAGIVHFTSGLKKPRHELSLYLSEGLPVSGGEAVSFLADFRRNKVTPKILGGNA